MIGTQFCVLFSTNKQIFPVCRILVFFAMRLSCCETCIGVNEWLEQDSFKFITYCFPWMCRFLLFAMRLGSHCGIWLSHECVEFCCFAQRLSSHYAIYYIMILLK